MPNPGNGYYLEPGYAPDVPDPSGAWREPGGKDIVQARLALPFPFNLTPPSISGIAQVGQTLMRVPGTWTNSPTSFVHQWAVNGTAISGANGTSYVPVTADIGKTITVTTTASNAAGSGTATSAPTSAVTAAAAALAISGANGTATVGDSTSFTPTIFGGTAPYTVSATGLPPGRSITNAVTGLTSGTYTTTGTYNAVYTVTDSAGATASFTRTVTVAAAAPALQALSLSPSTATTGSAYSGTVTGKTAGSTITLSGAGAAGLTVSGSSVTGTPTAVGTVDLVETLSGATNNPRTTSGALSISASPPANAGLAMTQLPAGRVYQRSAKTGGGAGKGAGSIAVPITLTSAASAIDYRIRDADATSTTVQDWTGAATNVPASATSVTCSGVPADARRYLIDLRANGDSAQIVLGTSPVMMGRLIALSGQSQMVRQFAKIPTYTGTNASLGVTISPYCGVYATYTDTSATNGGLSTPAWAPPADNGNYGSTFAAEFLRRQIGSSGVACAMIGHSVGSTAISAWAPGTANNVQLRSVLDAAGGFEAFYWHQGGDDAGAGTTKAAYKSALDAMFADIAQHNAVYGANFTKLLTAMATRLAAGAGSTSAVTMIRQAAKEWAATNSGVYLEPHDLNLEDSVHQGQPGNIVLAQHAHRALASNDVGPTLGTPSRTSGSAVITIPVNLPTGATTLALTGNAYTRFSVFPSGQTTGALTVSAVSYNSTAKTLALTLSAAPADSQALDVYAFLHPDPSGTTANADMIRDDRTDGDGITVGRSLEPSTTAPVICPAISPPATARTAQMNFYDSTQGQSAAGLAAWNDINTTTATTPTTVALKDPSAAATGWSATWTTAPKFGNAFGVTGVSGVPDAVATTAVYIDNTNAQSSMTLRVSGLTPNRSHKLQTYSSRSGSGTARITNVTAGGGSSTVNAYGNNALVTIASAVADASGNLDIVISQGASTQYAYLNAAILSEN